MKHPIKKAFYLGVCAAAHAKHFVEEEVKRLLAAGHITEEEGKTIVKHSMNKMQADRKSLQKAVKASIKQGVKDAKPILHEGHKLAKDVAAEIVREAHATVKGKAGKVKRRVKRVKKVAKAVKASAGKMKKTARKIKVKAKKKAKAKVRKVVKKIRKTAKKTTKKKAKKHVVKRKVAKPKGKKK